MERRHRYLPETEQRLPVVSWVETSFTLPVRPVDMHTRAGQGTAPSFRRKNRRHQ